MAPLAPHALTTALAELPGWELRGEKLVKDFRFGSFKEALSFLVRVGLEAEALGHHPEIHNVYSHVRLELCTHDAGNRVTSRDIDLARSIEHFNWRG